MPASSVSPVVDNGPNTPQADVTGATDTYSVGAAADSANAASPLTDTPATPTYRSETPTPEVTFSSSTDDSTLNEATVSDPSITAGAEAGPSDVYGGTDAAAEATVTSSSSSGVPYEASVNPSIDSATPSREVDQPQLGDEASSTATQASTSDWQAVQPTSSTVSQGIYPSPSSEGVTSSESGGDAAPTLSVLRTNGADLGPSSTSASEGPLETATTSSGTCFVLQVCHLRCEARADIASLCSPNQPLPSPLATGRRCHQR